MISSFRSFFLIIACLATAAAPTFAAGIVTNIQTTVRGSQVFVTWNEADTPAGTTLNVYVADRPISAVDGARQVAHHVERRSARDWWADPTSFEAKAKPTPPVGWQLDAGKPRLDPTGGLFVYTATPDDDHPLYFAVTTVDAEGREATDIVLGANAATNGVAVRPGPIAAFWQAEGPEPAAGAGRGLPLWMKLHGKSGVIAGMEYLAFGDASMGWRAGLPFKFSVRIENGAVVIQPTDRTWVNRPHKDSSDGRAPAIWSFWYGYNSHIFDEAAMTSGVPTNYTEHRLQYILDFTARRYETDRNRTYLSGSSMGGCGTVSFGLRHPELFAALHARVPIVSYTYEGAASATRLEASAWPGSISPEVPTSDDLPLLERMNGVRLVERATADLPPLYMTHGRNDGSIPWVNNPPFYRALDDARQAYAVWWDEGIHSTAGKNAPADVQDWTKSLLRYRLNESYPAFSRASSDRNPGDGRATDGDLIGWLNRGFDWTNIVDAPARYEISITAAYDGLTYPVRADVTLRRRQRFLPKAGETLHATVGNEAPREIAVDDAGRLTIRDVTLQTAEPVRIVITNGGR